MSKYIFLKISTNHDSGSCNCSPDWGAPPGCNPDDTPCAPGDGTCSPIGDCSPDLVCNPDEPD